MIPISEDRMIFIMTKAIHAVLQLGVDSSVLKQLKAFIHKEEMISDNQMPNDQLWNIL